ncbi:Rox3-domain-containing protein [Xylariomycetidae sp. FL0641]|nr:Rox3-domain-containing protein [Xylariomycetidae sp. FL0641]
MATMSFNPQTPQSPSQFSPSTAEGTSSMNTSMTSITTSLPTPAHSVNGSAQPPDNSHDTTMSDESSHKCKYPFEETGDHEQKKVHIEDPRKIGIADLHLDVGEKYLLCSTPYSLPSVNLSEDLYEKYGLTGIAAEVARVKPNGEKNALRKTYKGQIKTLGLSGHFDVVKKEPSTLMGLVCVAEEDWHNRVVAGRDIDRGFSQATQASLTKATTMARGHIPKEAWDSSVLGDLAPGNLSKKGLQDPTGRAGTTPGTPIGSAAGAVGKSVKVLPQVDRARRINKKRSYQDSSFEGYSDAYGDEDGGGYSTGEDRSSKLKRRKQVRQTLYHGNAQQLTDTEPWQWAVLQ